MHYFGELSHFVLKCWIREKRTGPDGSRASFSLSHCPAAASATSSLTDNSCATSIIGTISSSVATFVTVLNIAYYPRCPPDPECPPRAQGPRSSSSSDSKAPSRFSRA
eukprot:Amastigsp_a6511_5.p2 type:complete len:108 gc:universal Amastigsp_a6511_5:555-878(+)